MLPRLGDRPAIQNEAAAVITTKPHKILFPTDFSHTGDLALQLAVSFARHAWAELVLVHVQQPGAIYTGDFYHGPPEPDELTLNRMLKSLNPRIHGLRCSRFLLSGEPAETISKFAVEHEIDLIVVGTHGCNGIASVIVGSTALEIIEQAPCPVLAISTLPRSQDAQTISPPDPNVPLSAKQLLDTLDDLVTTCVDSEYGLGEATRDVRHSGLAIFLEDRAEQRRSFAEEIQLVATARGQVPNRRGSLQGKLFRKWLHLEAALGDDEAIVEALLREEQQTSDQYRTALGFDLPDDVRETLERHLAEIDLLERGLLGIQASGALTLNAPK